MQDIYSYIDARDYLKDFLALKKRSSSSFSLRAWAKQLGMKSHAPLHDILNKKRNIPKSLVPELLKSIKLVGREKEYFEVLIDYQRAKSGEQKKIYKEKLERISPVELRTINDIDAYKYITDPLHIILAEMTQLKSYNPSSLWIKQSLRETKNLKEIEDIIKRLKQLKVIEEKEEKTIKHPEHIYTEIEIESSVIQSYHKECMQMAIEQISKQTVQNKEYNSLCFNIKKTQLPKIKEELRKFVNQMINDFEAPAHEGDESYQLNLQFFSLTKS